MGILWNSNIHDDAVCEWEGDKNNVSRERDQLISEMYNYNVGTDVDQMAAALKRED